MYSIFERLLKERGVTVAEVSRATGIAQTTMSNWKKRNNMLNPRNLQKIADYFGVSMDYMMGQTKAIPVFIPDDFREVMERKAFKSEADYLYYKESQELAQEIFDNRDLHALFMTARDSTPDDLHMVRDFLLRLKETNHDG